MYLELNDNKYEVIVERKNNKNTYIRVKEDLKIYITTNRWVKDKDIEKLIINNSNLIRRMLNKKIKHVEQNKKFMILGKEVDVISLSSQKEPELYGNKFYIKNSNNLEKYLRDYAYKLFKTRLDSIYKYFREPIPYPNLKIRRMKSRWGVCNKKNVYITLNLELIKKDIKYTDYVIVHELSHFVYFNHSKDFWNLVSKYYPNYKELRKEMRD